VSGEQHEFSADSLVQMLEDYEDAQGMNRHMALFGTPERAARTFLQMDNSCSNYDVDGIEQSCVTCPMNMNGKEYPKNKCYAYTDGDYDALLGWLRGDGE